MKQIEGEQQSGGAAEYHGGENGDSWDYQHPRAKSRSKPKEGRVAKDLAKDFESADKVKILKTRAAREGVKARVQAQHQRKQARRQSDHRKMETMS